MGKPSRPRTEAISASETRPKLWAAQAEVAQAEGDVWIVGIKLGQQPRRGGVGCEELHNRMGVDVVVRRLLASRASR